MKKIIPLLKNVMLFNGIEEKDLGAMLSCLGGKLKNYKKGETIFSIDDPNTSIGVLVSGEIQISKDDVLGNHMIMMKMKQYDVFGEAITCAQKKQIPYYTTASADSQILFLNYRKILTTCSSACSFHSRLIENLLYSLARKNLMLNDKIEIISKRTTREKILFYLNSQAQKVNSPAFAIPFNRQEMADYLCVERSALSTELGKLRDEGIISFSKSKFTLLSGR